MIKGVWLDYRGQGWWDKNDSEVPGSGHRVRSMTCTEGEPTEEGAVWKGKEAGGSRRADLAWRCPQP